MKEKDVPTLKQVIAVKNSLNCTAETQQLTKGSNEKDQDYVYSASFPSVVKARR